MFTIQLDTSELNKSYLRSVQSSPVVTLKRENSASEILPKGSNVSLKLFKTCVLPLNNITPNTYITSLNFFKSCLTQI